MSLQKLLSFRFKYFALLQWQALKPYSYFKDIVFEKGKKRIFIFLAADYGNLGDVAITYAQTQFLENNTNAQIIEIPISKSLEGLWFVKRNINSGDVITSTGGGNLGDLYNQIEFIRQLVVRFFSKNKIISFPQTFDFSKSKEGVKALETAINVYNSHKNLVIVAREETSYSLMRKHFTKATILLTPDIVLTLDKSKPEKKRQGVVFCLRNDKEKKLTKKQQTWLIEYVKKRFQNVCFYDTHIAKTKLSLIEREEELGNIWLAFKEAEFVVTDRLHGMIFCYITNTPCLVFLNNNHKIFETYEWISNSKNIFLIREFNQNTLTEILSKIGFFKGKNQDLNNSYNKLLEIINFHEI